MNNDENFDFLVFTLYHKKNKAKNFVTKKIKKEFNAKQKFTSNKLISVISVFLTLTKQLKIYKYICLQQTIFFLIILDVLPITVIVIIFIIIDQ